MLNSQKILKQILLTGIIISFLFSLTNYTNSSENLDSIVYVMAIGMDKGETSKYKISLQLTDMESGATDAATKSDSNSSGSKNGEDSSGTSQATNYRIYTVETDSLDSSINIVNGYVNKNVSLSHCKLLLLSEDIAKEGIKDIVDSMVNKVEIRPDCTIVVSKIPAEEFQGKDKPKISSVLADYYDIASNPENGRGYSESVKLSDFYSRLNDTFCEPYATLGITSNPKENTIMTNKNQTSNLDVQSRSLISNPPESAVETIGLAVFKKDKLVGTLSSNQTMAFQLITHNFNYCTLNMPSPFHQSETLDVYIATAKNPKIKVNIGNGSPFVEIKLYITAKVLSFNTNSQITLTEENLKIIENHVRQYLQEQVYDYLNETSKNLNTDIAEIGRFAVKNFKTSKEWEQYNWLENYRNATFKVEVSVNIKSEHLLTSD